MEIVNQNIESDMIREIRIHNYKSIVDLTIDLGRFNIIIGPNGCGKSNIIEAIAFGCAAVSDKLDTEYLINRDIRFTTPEFMVNAFDSEREKQKGKFKHIHLSFKGTSEIINTNAAIIFDEKEEHWINLTQKVNKEIIKDIKEFDSLPQDSSFRRALEIMKKDGIEPSSELLNYLSKKLEYENIPAPQYRNFLIYHPSENSIRNDFYSPISPFGVRGQGLLGYLKHISTNPNRKRLFEEITEGLYLLDWFEGINIPKNLLSNEFNLSIGDRYLSETLHYFDKRSANDGFLFLLFYLTLFNSPDTPQFFAVDNIETALNPKLCIRFTENLIKTAFNHNKQVIVTTHNPYVLDGLDLKNNEIRLFVARRNLDGHTCLERINYSPNRTIPLSELWMSGIIGGLPDNF